MNRNEALIPWLALASAGLLGLILAYSFTTHPPPGPEVAAIPRLALVPADLKSHEVFLTSLIMVLVIYGVHGLVSVWLEGEELEPGARPPRRAPWAFWGVLACLAAVLALSASFAQVIAQGLHTGPNTVLEGLLMGSLLLLFALALALYKHHFLPEEVLVEEPDSDVPW